MTKILFRSFFFFKDMYLILSKYRQQLMWASSLFPILQQHYLNLSTATTCLQQYLTQAAAAATTVMYKQDSSDDENMP